ncbi:MAG: ABC transporter permease subunit [Proteobacteria bacterium]|nr:ABC transporter permease subunit [Pseudomonadota bacterium]
MTEAIISRAYTSTPESDRRAPPKRLPLTFDGLWHNVGFRSLLYQILIIGAVVSTAFYMIGNAQVAMERLGISTGFGFLTEEAGFAIGESLISYDSSDTYIRAYLVAILNTLKVSAVSVIGATVLGVLIGIARLSSNYLISKIASIYIEIFRNTPQLVQIIFWYTLVTRLPHPKQAWNFFDWVFISNRGLIMAWPADSAVYAWVGLTFVIACGGAFGVVRWTDARRRRTGQTIRALWWNVGLVIGIPLLTWFALGAPTEMVLPIFKGFNFTGGIALSPEFLALLLGLSLYIAAFIAEIVRSGIQAVNRGQIEAARSVGLGRADLYMKVILPQALRVIVPPATAQYVSLTKNSSLGVAIGYPELFNINNTITTTSGNTIECISIMMAVYLSIAFTTAVIMNVYNKAVQIKER